MDALADVLGFDSVAVPFENASTRFEGISSDARAVFEQRNPLEMAVYRYALDGLHTRCT